MTIEQYKQSLLYATFDNSITKVFSAFVSVLDAIREAMIYKDLKHFNYYIGYPPDDAISDYVDATNLPLDKWIEQKRPVIAIVYLDAFNSNLDVEAIGTYDTNCDINIDFIYPHYNFNEYFNSTVEMHEFIDVFIDMFEMSGRNWHFGGERIAFDRTPMSVIENTYSMYSNVLCHLITCSTTFKIFKTSATDNLEI